MGLRFNPQPIARYDQSLLPVLSSNFEQLKRLLAQIPTESIGTDPPENPYLGQPWVDTNSYTIRVWDGTRWLPDSVPFVPVITQNVAISKTSHYSEYTRTTNRIEWEFTFTLTTAGTAGQPIVMTLPFTTSNINSITGWFNYLDIGNTNFGGVVIPNTTSSVFFQPAGANNILGPFGGIGVANGDVLRGHIVFKV